MSSINPDKVTAERLAGLAPMGLAAAPAPGTGDGSLVDDPAVRAPLVLSNRSFTEVTDIICGYCEQAPGRWWLPLFGLTSTVAGLGMMFVTYLIITGIGTWGLNNTVGWAWD